MSGKGGPRPNSGRRPGSKLLMSQLSQAEAKLAGILPHEWLLKVVRGDPIEQSYTVDVLDKKGQIIGQEVMTKTVYPDLQMRHDAAKAAAPYYAPRLATQMVTLHQTSQQYPLIDTKQLSPSQLLELEKILGSIKPASQE
jgi:hypothetical protein